MNIWENTVLTDQGKALQAKLLQGQTLKITRVTTGSKKVPIVDLRQQTDVTEGGYDITLQPSRTEGEKTILPVLLENTGLKDSYDLWQVGFFAEDPDEGEILFCISQASQAKHIPSEAESPGYSVTWDFYFNTSNTIPFEVVLNSSGLVNIEAYQEHTEAISKVIGRVDSLNSDLSSVIHKATDTANKLTDYVAIREQWMSYSVGASSSVNYNLSPPSLSGYKLLFTQCAITNSPRVTCHYCDNSKVYFWNHGTGTVSAIALIRFIYIKV